MNDQGQNSEFFVLCIEIQLNIKGIYYSVFKCQNESPLTQIDNDPTFMMIYQKYYGFVLQEMVKVTEIMNFNSNKTISFTEFLILFRQFLKEIEIDCNQSSYYKNNQFQEKKESKDPKWDTVNSVILNCHQKKPFPTITIEITYENQTFKVQFKGISILKVFIFGNTFDIKNIGELYKEQASIEKKIEEGEEFTLEILDTQDKYERQTFFEPTSKTDIFEEHGWILNEIYL